MPFIRGKYHINPVVGEALEAAREAEAALLELEHEGERGSSEAAEKAPVHRVEIEAAQVVPSHSGRAQRGYVARVHRQASGQEAGEKDEWGGNTAGAVPRGNLRDGVSSAVRGSREETHAFANHGDLVNFLSDELGREDRK